VGDKAKALPIVNQNCGPLSHEPENQLLQRGSMNLPDVIFCSTNMDYSKPIVLPKHKPTEKPAEPQAPHEWLRRRA